MQFFKRWRTLKVKYASCRTFSFLHELEKLLDQDLIKGGDLNNAIIYVNQPLAKETIWIALKRTFNKEEIAVKKNGILDNLTLHHPNEAARHKLLDVVGDLALVGMPIKGRIIANKPGHKINTICQRVAQSDKKTSETMLHSGFVNTTGHGC